MVRGSTTNPTKPSRTLDLATALLLAAASVALLAGFILHPPESVDLATTANTIRDTAAQWAAAHWLLAVGGVLLAVAGVRAARASTTPMSRTPRVAWIGLAVSAILALEIFILEATVAVERGKAGDADGLAGLLPVEIPGILGLLGLNAFGALLWFADARSRPAYMPRGVAIVAAVASLMGLAGSIAFILGQQALSNLQYGTALFLLALLALGVRNLASRRVQAAARVAPRTG